MNHKAKGLQRHTTCSENRESTKGHKGKKRPFRKKEETFGWKNLSEC